MVLDSNKVKIINMTGFTSVALLICVVSISFDLGSATKCYQCMGSKGGGTDCENHVDKVPSAECVSPSPICMTLVVENVLTRTCGLKGQCDTLKDTSTYCKTCETDLCNVDSGAFASSYSTSVAVSLALFSLMKLFM